MVGLRLTMYIYMYNFVYGRSETDHLLYASDVCTNPHLKDLLQSGGGRAGGLYSLALASIIYTK